MSDTQYTVKWDQPGEKYYDQGVDRAVIYPMAANGTYESGAGWSGVTKISDNSDGGDVKDFYANNKLYASLRGTEKPTGNIEAYTYPDEFAECDGSKALVPGVGIFAKQQKRKAFGLTYRSFIGEGDDPEKYYVIHILYGLTVSPSERAHDTINEDPDLEALSWDYSGQPVDAGIAGFRPMGEIEIDSRTTSAYVMSEIENTLYGNGHDAGRIMLPGEIVTLISNSSSGIDLLDMFGTFGNAENHGVSFAWNNSTKKYTITGTPDAGQRGERVVYSGPVPSWLRPGIEYDVEVTSNEIDASHPENIGNEQVVFQIQMYRSGASTVYASFPTAQDTLSSHTATGKFVMRSDIDSVRIVFTTRTSVAGSPLTSVSIGAAMRTSNS